MLKSPRSYAPTTPLARFPAEEIEAITAAGTPQSVTKGTYIFKRGERGDSMYIVLDGSVQLVFGEEKSPKKLGPGEFFGELALLTPEHTRTASAIAIEPTVLCRFGIDALENLSANTPRLVVSFLRSACAYLLASEQKLVEDLRRKNRELEDTLDYLRRTFEELSHQELLAHTDELTGLYNRRCMGLQINRFIQRAEATHAPLALLAMDLDGLKPINDSHGHPAGDEVLRRVGAVIKSCVRRSDLPCRVGGDEFSILLADITQEQARNRAEEVRKAIARAIIEVDGVALRITASIGGTMFETGEAARDFMERSDRLLYDAKSSGRNCFCWQGQITTAAPEEE